MKPTTVLPFMEGFFAFREKIGEEYNPYQFGSYEYTQWRAGWYTAKRESALDWKTIITAIAVAVIGIASAIPNLFPSPYITSTALLMTAVASVAVRALSGGQVSVKFGGARRWAASARKQD